MARNNYYNFKLVKDLLADDIILHPLYRSDGLLLINRYKKITSSILNNIRKNFPADLPLLVTHSDEALQEFLEMGINNSTMFINDLTEIFKAHHDFISIPISVNFYIENKTQESTNEAPLFSSPFWESFQDLLEAPRLKLRAAEIKQLLVSTIKENKEVMDLLDKLKSYHDALYIHNINSLSVSLVIGLAIELSDEDLINLGLSALLADIGFLNIEKEKFKLYLDQPNKNKDLITTHTMNSIEMIKDIDICRNKSIIYGIYEHHEFYNGTGLPEGKKGNNISLFGRILAIAKAYDDMVGGHVKEKNLTVPQAQRKLWDGKGKMFDPDILKIFFAKISVFKVNQKVLIDESNAGKIIGFTNYLEAPILPIVQLDSGEIIDFYSDNSPNKIKFIKGA